MDESTPDRERVVTVILANAGVAVPDRDIAKLAEMYEGAEPARQALRSVELGETEPVITFTAGSESGDE